MLMQDVKGPRLSKKLLAARGRGSVTCCGRRLTGDAEKTGLDKAPSTLGGPLLRAKSDMWLDRRRFRLQQWNSNEARGVQ